MLSYGDSLSSDQFYQREKVQDHLKTLASLSRQTLPLLKQFGSSGGHNDLIPLFAGENGYEYQLELAWWSKLPFLRCPSNPEERPFNHDPMQLLTSRVSTDITFGAIPMPKLVVQLGRLWVRGNTRESEDDDPISERTDWEIMVDLENEDLPLWIFVGRQTLIDRRDNADGFGEPPLTIFDGLMTHEEGDYDSACILPSTGHLGQSQASAPAFSNICDMIRKSRGIRGPVVYLLYGVGLDTIAAGEQIQSLYSGPELPELMLDETSYTIPSSEIPRKVPGELKDEA